MKRRVYRRRRRRNRKKLSELDEILQIVAILALIPFLAFFLSSGSRNDGRISRSKAKVNSSSDIGNYLDLGYTSPVDAPIKVTSEIGRRWGRKHKGQDIDTEAGVAVRSCSPGEGVILFAGYKRNGFGNQVHVKISGATVIYAHLKDIESSITRGTIVKQNRLLGWVGSTGNVRHGPGGDGSHLHIEFRDTAPGFKTPIFGHKQRKT